MKGRIVCDKKQNATELVHGSLSEFECFTGCDCVNSFGLHQKSICVVIGEGD